MVAAVSNAGGLGVFGAGSGAPEFTRKAIRQIREMTDRPFGGNAPLALPNGLENARVMLEEKVPVINYSMGKGDWIVREARKYGGKVIASVTSAHFARKAQEQGADAVIVAGYEAAGHSGDVTSFILIPRIVELVDIPVIAAGGIVNGAGLVAALSLGAEGVSMGTRFTVSQESPLHQNWKDKAIGMDVNDTLYSDRFDGIPNRLMNSVEAQRMMKSIPNVLHVFLDSFGIARELQIPWARLVLDMVKKGPKEIDAMMRMSRLLRGMTVALTTGDLDTGLWASGMSIGLIHDQPGAAEVVERIVAEAEDALRRLNGMAAIKPILVAHA
jgi:enoyl-[acyl-carrier protein] reductase II